MRRDWTRAISRKGKAHHGTPNARELKTIRRFAAQIYAKRTFAAAITVAALRSATAGSGGIIGQGLGGTGAEHVYRLREMSVMHTAAKQRMKNKYPRCQLGHVTEMHVKASRQPSVFACHGIIGLTRFDLNTSYSVPPADRPDSAEPDPPGADRPSVSNSPSIATRLCRRSASARIYARLVCASVRWAVNTGK